MNSELCKDEVVNRIKNILNKRFMIDTKIVEDNEKWNKNLLGRPYAFTARDLMYLFFEIENEFNIHIEKEDILSEKFSNLEGIVNIVLTRSHQKVG